MPSITFVMVRERTRSPSVGRRTERTIGSFPTCKNVISTSDHATPRDLESLITARRPLDEINEGFAGLAAGVGVRTVIDL
jgi:hypothetical protein